MTPKESEGLREFRRLLDKLKHEARTEPFSSDSNDPVRVDAVATALEEHYKKMEGERDAAVDVVEKARYVGPYIDNAICERLRDLDDAIMHYDEARKARSPVSKDTLTRERVEEITGGAEVSVGDMQDFRNHDEVQRERIETEKANWEAACWDIQRHLARITQLEAVVREVVDYAQNHKERPLSMEWQVAIGLRIGALAVALDNTEDAEPCDVCGTVGGGGKVEASQTAQSVQYKPCPKCKDGEA